MLRPGHRAVLQDERTAPTALNPDDQVVRARVVRGRRTADAELRPAKGRHVTHDVGSLLLKVRELDAGHVRLQVPQVDGLSVNGHVVEEDVQLINGLLNGLLSGLEALNRGGRRGRRRRGDRRLRARRHGSTTGGERRAVLVTADLGPWAQASQN